MEVSDQLHASAASPPGERDPGTHWIGVWVGPRDDTEAVEKKKIFRLPGNELQHSSR
jgi:hypothetical protein